MIATISVATTAFAQTSTYTVQYHQTEARKMLANINAFRTSGSWIWDESNTQKVSVAPMGKLVYDYDLEVSAMIRAAELVESYGHVRPNGKHSATTFSIYGISGENIAYLESATLNKDEMFEDWKEDDKTYEGQSHRRDMLTSNFKAFAVACVEYNGNFYWVQEFRDTIVSTTPTPAFDGTTNVNIDLDGSSNTSINGIKFPDVKVTVPKISKLKCKSKKVSFSWNPQAGVKSYQINYSYNNKFKSKSVQNVSSNCVSMTIKGLSKGKTLYIRIRAKDKKEKFTKWSKTYKIKV